MTDRGIDEPIEDDEVVVDYGKVPKSRQQAAGTHSGNLKSHSLNKRTNNAQAFATQQTSEDVGVSRNFGDSKRSANQGGLSGNFTADNHRSQALQKKTRYNFATYGTIGSE